MASKKKITMADVVVTLDDFERKEKADAQVLLRCTKRERDSIRETAHEFGLSIKNYLRLLHVLALKSVGREV